MSAKSPFTESVGEILPSQWYAGMKPMDLRFQGPKQLMLALLVDALRCLQTSSRVHSTDHRRSLAEAERWIADRKAQGPFAFETVC
jgi:hypothetical protein